MGAELATWIAPLEVRLKRLDETRRKLHELDKRWNNRLVLEGLSRSKAYLDGRLAIVLVVQISRTAARDDLAADQHHEMAGCLCWNGVFVINRKDGELRPNDRCNYQPVFIGSIQLVEPDEMASVYAYEICNNVCNIGGESLY